MLYYFLRISQKADNFTLKSPGIYGEEIALNQVKNRAELTWIYAAYTVIGKGWVYFCRTCVSNCTNIISAH